MQKPGEIKQQNAGHHLEGVSVSFIAQAVRFLLTVLHTVVLARLLTKQDFGLFAMSWLFVGFLYNIRDFGLSNLTVQKSELDSEEWSSIFWVSFAFGFLLFIATGFMAPILSLAFSERALTGITLALSSLFLLSAFNVQHLALLRRRMLFLPLSLIQTISLAIGVTVAVVTASIGMGYWSLVLLYSANELSITLMSWFYLRVYPRRPRLRSGINRITQFGKQITLHEILQYLGFSFDQLLVGLFFGARELGVYNRCFAILEMPGRQLQTPIQTVAVPALSRLTIEPHKYAQTYGILIELIGFIWFPFVTLCLVFPGELITVILGSEWSEGSAILRILAIVALCRPFYFSLNWVHVSLGQTGKLQNWGLLSLTVIVISLPVGILGGSLGIAVAYALVMVFLTAYRFTRAINDTPLKLSEVMANLRFPLLSLALWLATAIAVNCANDPGLASHYRLLIAVSACVAVQAVFLVLLRGYRTALAEVFRTTFLSRRNPHE